MSLHKGKGCTDRAKRAVNNPRGDANALNALAVGCISPSGQACHRTQYGAINPEHFPSTTAVTGAHLVAGLLYFNLVWLAGNGQIFETVKHG